MRKKSLLKSIAILLGCMLFSTSLATIPAKAEGNPTFDTFVMQKGAALRLKEGSNGMRFTAEISEAEYTALKAAGAKFGVLIVAKDLLKTTPLTPETVFGENPAFYFTNETETSVNGKIAMLHISSPTCGNLDADANIEIGGAIANILVSNFTRSFVGVAYVALPTVNAETGETTYTYHFAPYYEGDMANSTRCMYYVAQRAIESNDSVEDLKTLYINPFGETSRYTDYLYAVTVRHHYLVHNANGEHEIIHTETQKQYGKLNESYTAHPIEKPTDTGKEQMEGNFIFDADRTLDAREGIVYAGGMQTLDMYYELATDLSEDHKDHTLAAILADFLDKNKADVNFGLGDANNPDSWTPIEYPEGATGDAITGITLHTDNPNSNQTLILSEQFFDDLRGFGVKTITFTLDSHDKKMRFALYQEESDALLPAYDPTTKEPLTSSDINQTRITINIDEVTPNGGVRIELHQSASSNTGNYVFENVVFGFETVVPPTTK